MSCERTHPAYVSASGYRYYEEPQLLTLQQILFYRELGLESHGAVLEKNLARTRTLIATIDKTIDHLRGTKKMSSEEMLLVGPRRAAPEKPVSMRR